MVKAILDPIVARAVFLRETGACGRDWHPVTQPFRVRWRITEARFPVVRAEARGPGGALFFVVADCRNYDFDPPTVHYEDSSERQIPWQTMTRLGRVYLHQRGNDPPRPAHDIVWIHPDGGFICVPGLMGYHEAHAEDNWREVRRSSGRLYYVIQSSIEAVNLPLAARTLS